MEHNTFAGSSGNDNYSTPKDFIAKLEVQLGLRFDDFDPCPINPEGLRTYDGNASWPEKVGRKPLENVFINFPYSDPVPWLRRCVRESQNGKTVAALMRGDRRYQYYLVPRARQAVRRGAHLRQGAHLLQVLQEGLQQVRHQEPA